LGCKHPDYLFRSLTARQFLDWEIYNSLEPIGMFYHSGLIAAVIANFSMCKKPGKWFNAFDFMPRYKKKKQTVEEMEKVLMGLVHLTGGNR
jgi:hypothetical protein